IRNVSNTGAYGNHGGEVLASSLGSAMATYRCLNKKGVGYAVYTIRFLLEHSEDMVPRSPRLPLNPPLTNWVASLASIRSPYAGRTCCGITIPCKAFGMLRATQ